MKIFRPFNYFVIFQRHNFRMIDHNSWCQQSDNILRYLYEDLKIFNWNTISKQLSQRLGFQTDAAQCRNRYAMKYGPVIRNQWTLQQEKQLYRLHNQNGNKWAVIAQNLLGRNDNCVKNHFYSKLRKSLRTINKIGKLHLKKSVKQVSDVVLFKLTEATDESLRPDSQIPKQTFAMCLQLKNKLLQYQMDQKDIKQNIDYSHEKQIIQGLAQFNKLYKKKPKKLKTTQLGTQNLKKRICQKKDKSQHAELSRLSKNADNMEIKRQQKSQQHSERFQFQSVSNSFRNYHGRNSNKKLQIYNYQNGRLNGQQPDQVYYPPRSQSEYSVAKKTVNYLIKAPSLEVNQGAEDNRFDSKFEHKQGNSIKMIPFITVPPPAAQTKPNKVEDILKAEGILQNGYYGSNKQFFRRSSSVRSFSVCEDSSHPDMFGEDLGFGFKELSQLDNQSQIFNNQHNQ